MTSTSNKVVSHTPELSNTESQMNSTPKKEWTKAENQIAENHSADVQNGLSESAASQSDAFERAVRGMDEDNYCGGRYGGAGYSGCYD